MKKKVEIKTATYEDYQSVADIYNESILANAATMDETIKTKEDIDKWVRNFNDRERLFILKEDDINIGWGIVKKYSDREGYRLTCETAVYITSSKTRLGYGTLMKKYIIDACKKLNYKHLVAKIWASNKGSIVYNEKLGYTIVGTQNKIGYKNNQWIDVVIMQYIIE